MNYQANLFGTKTQGSLPLSVYVLLFFSKSATRILVIRLYRVPFKVRVRGKQKRDDGRARELLPGGQGRNLRIVPCYRNRTNAVGVAAVKPSSNKLVQHFSAFQVSTTVSRIQVARSSHTVRNIRICAQTERGRKDDPTAWD